MCDARESCRECRATTGHKLGCTQGAGPIEIPVMVPRPVNPDCVQGKHRACAGDAWDDTTDTLTECSCDCHNQPEHTREELIALASWWCGWCTDMSDTEPKLAELGGFLLEVKHRMALDREETK